MPHTFSYNWYYNRVTGVITQYLGGEATLLLATGIWKGPFDTYQAAVDFYNQNKAQHPDYAPPTYPGNIPAQIGNTVTGANTAAKAQVQNAVDSALPALGDYETWILRVGEILLGLVLIGVGVAGWSGVAKTAAKAAALV